MSVKQLLVGAVLFSCSSVAWGAGTMIAETLADGVTRFYRDDDAKRLALPSMAFEKPMNGKALNADEAKVHPVYSSVGEDLTRAVIDIPEGTLLYGTGEVAGPLVRNGRVVSTWNTDAYGYQDDAKSLYQSHPWVLAVRPDGTAFGVLADTTYRCEIDLTHNISFTAPGSSFAVVVIERSSPIEVVKELAELTGKIPMPPKWALGYHQCRYSYFPESRVIEIAQEFLNRKIPCDVLWFDIDYMDGFRCFTYDKKLFPNPNRLNNRLNYWGFSTVWMIDPGIKVDPAYDAYTQMEAGKHGILTKDGKTYQGDVWPGACVFPDFTRKETREWWAGRMAQFVGSNKINGIWNDMNEPAVFNVKSKTMPEDNVHRPDPEIRGREGSDTSHARFHNIYGMQMVRATYDGVLKANPGARPFVLSRANYIGGQRYAATWTGDNSANWYHVETSIPMVLNLSLSGTPFCGPDIGGYAGNGDGEQFARWMGFGAMFPFARGHTGKENINKEPWAFGPEVEKTCRQALERRYLLLPYLYTLFYEAHTTGAPVCRPVFFADPKDPALRTEDDGFLVGGDLLIAPQVVPDRSRTIAMPKAPGGLSWRKFDFGDGDNKDLPGMYQRPGSILFTGKTYEDKDKKDKLIVPLAAWMPVNQLELYVCLDAEGKAEGKLYSDEGDGWGFRDLKLYRYATYSAVKTGDSVKVSVTKQEGDQVRMLPKGKIPRKCIVHLMLPDREVIAEGMDGDDFELSISK